MIIKVDLAIAVIYIARNNSLIHLTTSDTNWVIMVPSFKCQKTKSKISLSKNFKMNNKWTQETSYSDEAKIYNL